MHRILSAALLMASLPSFASAATILLIRHAERNPGMSPDVLLNAAGEQRAKDLADVMKDANIKRIYVTEVRRTQQTAEPLAAQLHLKPEVIAAKDVDVLVSRLRSLGEDETVLVVGHANTAPQVVEKLGGGSVPPLGENEYDRLTVVYTGAGGNARVLTLRYGKPAH
jgi:broad specificity phosphatase PhoE